MTRARIGAVGYLNAKPLVYGLDRQPDRFAVRFDVPSRCAALLHEGAIDVGLIPSIEYLADRAYRIVPDLAIASRGPVASVALFSRKPVADIASIALDTSSRTSVALLKVLCAKRFGIRPAFADLSPDLRVMTGQCDAALIIGDAALFADHAALGLMKIDLGEEWTAMTGLPFVWAIWAGRAGAIDLCAVEALQAARDAGVAAVDEIARDYLRAEPEKIAMGASYLRENIKFALGPEPQAGLRMFYQLAGELGLAPGPAALRYFEEAP